MLSSYTYTCLRRLGKILTMNNDDVSYSYTSSVVWEMLVAGANPGDVFGNALTV